MRREDFHYDLPEELIALKPTPERVGSRLLGLEGATGAMSHHQFSEVLDLVNPGDLMVFNNTKVIPARVFGQKESGGRVEVLVERVLNTFEVWAHVRASKSPKPGSRIILEDGSELRVEGREDALFHLRFLGEVSALDVLEHIGHMPLPPYINREDDDFDRERYQTVYAERAGAVAAPTAGLHFDEAIIDALRQKGVNIAYVTLHVGAGTFQPVRAEQVFDHVMHKEVMEVTEEVCQQVRDTKAADKRVVAVGTTCVRCLETAALNGSIQPYQGDTDIFIYPSFQYKVVDVLVTNFHLPESTLLMLVSAFSGYNNIMKAYRAAIEGRYRFFSYGDAMFLTRNPLAHLEIPNQSS